MNRAAAGDISLPLAVRRRIDAACDRFEQAWLEGASPRLEDFLESESEARDTLLRELLHLELYYRRREGAAATSEEFEQRFPASAVAVREVFHEFAAGDTRTESTRRAQAELDDVTPVEVGVGPLPARFGDYELLQELGVGGMGVVYRARQLSVSRMVALKLIRSDRLAQLPENDRRIAIERFTVEAQAAARVQHDHMVTVYEVGEVAGRQFFSMRYVEGKSLADLLIEGPLEGEEAARLLAPVCGAVHAAHQCGVLHRDLKPRNILLDDRTGRALVADFGLAKLLEGGRDVTTTGDVFGSPPYMSPEQTVDSGNVAATGDVYSLGATLYHLLTGRPPFMAASTLETLRQVLYDDVAPPRRLNPAIDRDLETICLKCLEKDPRQRYATAAELEAELERYLRGEPILARPLGPIGRLARWSRRNPVVAGLSATALLLLAAIAGVATIGYVRENAQRVRADQQRERADQNAAEKDEYFTLARHTIDTYLVQLSEDPRLRSHGLESLRRELLETAREFYDAFDHRAGDDLQLQGDRARAYLRLASITAELGDTAEARGFYGQSLAMLTELQQRQPGDPELLRLRVAAHNGLGSLRREVGELREAEREFRLALALAEEQRRYPGTGPSFDADAAECHLNLASVLPEEEREKPMRAAIGMWERLREGEPQQRQAAREHLARAYNNYAVLLRGAGRLSEAGEAFQRAEAMWRELVEDHPGIPEYRLDWAKCLNNLGIFYFNSLELPEKERLSRAEESHRRALALRERLVRDHPDVPDYRRELAAGYVNLGGVFDASERSGEAVQTYQEAIRHLEELVAAFPLVVQYRHDLAAAHNNLALAWQSERWPKKAIDELLLAREQFSALADLHEGDPVYPQRLAGVLLNLLMLEHAQERISLATAHAAELVQVRRRLLERDASTDAERRDLAEALSLQAGLLGNMGDIPGAEQALTEAIEVRPSSADDPESILATLQDYAVLIETARAAGRSQRQAELLGEAIGLLEPLVARDPAAEQPKRMLRDLSIVRAKVAGALGRHESALADWERALQLDSDPDSRTFLLLRRAAAVARLGRHAEAAAAAREAVAGEVVQPFFRYNAACALALAAEGAAADETLGESERSERRDVLAGEAVDQLRRAGAAGFFDDPAQLRQLAADPELTLLRSRPDFAELMPAPD